MPETTTKAPPRGGQPDLFGNVGPVPREIEDEEREATSVIKPTQGGGLTIEQLLSYDPKKANAILETRAKLLEQIQAAALVRTKPTDWTLYQDRDGHVVAVLRDSGAVNVRKFMGISIFNHRPIAGGVADPLIKEEKVPRLDKDDKPTGEMLDVLVAEMWADGICSLTGEPAQDVYCGLRSLDSYGKGQFVGRGHIQDLKASCRTTLDTKVVRILSGFRKVSGDVLTAAGINLEKCYRGSGYGNAETRAAGKVVEEGVAGEVAKLKEELVRRTGGDATAVRQLTVEITKDDKSGFKGFDSIDRLTKSWQVERAWKALKAHSVFGDDDKPAEKRP